MYDDKLCESATLTIEIYLSFIALHTAAVNIIGKTCVSHRLYISAIYLKNKKEGNALMQHVVAVLNKNQCQIHNDMIVAFQTIFHNYLSKLHMRFLNVKSFLYLHINFN